MRFLDGACIASSKRLYLQGFAWADLRAMAATTTVSWYLSKQPNNDFFNNNKRDAMGRRWLVTWPCFQISQKRNFSYPPSQSISMFYSFFENGVSNVRFNLHFDFWSWARAQKWVPTCWDLKTWRHFSEKISKFFGNCLQTFVSLKTT